MSNFLFNRLGNSRNVNSPPPQNNGLLNIISQYRQIQNDPGKILDILLNNGKISQQQYNDLQPIRNNPRQIAEYLSKNGNSSQINQAQQMVGNLRN